MENQKAQNTSPNAETLLKRASLFLEDGDFDSAKDYYNRVLDIDPECAKAYMGLFMVEEKITDESKLNEASSALSENKYFKKALRFADDEYKAILEGYVTESANHATELIYKNAIKLKNNATNINDCITALNELRKIKDFRESALYIEECCEKIYYSAFEAYRNNSANAYINAVSLFNIISDYRDSAELAKQYQEKANQAIYSNAIKLKNRAANINDSVTALTELRKVKDYREAKIYIDECCEVIYNAAAYSAQVNSHNACINAINLFNFISDYRDSAILRKECQEKANTLTAIANGDVLVCQNCGKVSRGSSSSCLSCGQRLNITAEYKQRRNAEIIIVENSNNDSNNYIINNTASDNIWGISLALRIIEAGLFLILFFNLYKLYKFLEYIAPMVEGFDSEGMFIVFLMIYFLPVITFCYIISFITQELQNNSLLTTTKIYDTEYLAKLLAKNIGFFLLLAVTAIFTRTIYDLEHWFELTDVGRMIFTSIWFDNFSGVSVDTPLLLFMACGLTNLIGLFISISRINNAKANGADFSKVISKVGQSVALFIVIIVIALIITSFS
ncbi:MAG: hypothetical protein FWD48_08850 [Oscillospiraceae bacterium]|nr:hypothetical protein [Oscillospiraceae bacterium]